MRVPEVTVDCNCIMPSETTVTNREKQVYTLNYANTDAFLSVSEN